MCSTCNKERGDWRFVDNSDECHICIARKEYDMVVCEECQQAHRHKDVVQMGTEPYTYACAKCRPDMHLLTCTVCSNNLPRSQFRKAGTKMPKTGIRRCNACHTCGQCKTYFEDERHMQTNSKFCCKCYVELQRFTCEVCQEAQAASAFDADVLRHARYDNGHFVCKRCKKNGFTPKDITVYMCSTGHTGGHLAFNTDLLHNRKRGHSPTLTCLAGQEKTAELKACASEYHARVGETHRRPQSEFSAASLKKHVKNPEHALLCMPCEGRGCTTRSARQGTGIVPVFACSNPKCMPLLKGASHFDGTALHNHSKRGDPLRCKTCTERAQSLKAKVQRDTAHHCTCKRVAPNRKHNSGCPLDVFLRSQGAFDWPGRCHGVTGDDRDFLNDIRTPWWKRATEPRQ